MEGRCEGPVLADSRSLARRPGRYRFVKMGWLFAYQKTTARGIHLRKTGRRVHHIRRSVLKQHKYKSVLGEFSRCPEELLWAAARLGAALHYQDAWPRSAAYIRGENLKTRGSASVFSICLTIACAV